MKTLVLLAFATACASDPADEVPDASSDPTPGSDASSTTSGDAPAVVIADPALRGPYDVGVRKLEVRDASRSRDLAIEIWYPIPPGATDGEDAEYALETAVAVLATLESDARRDAAPASGGPWPLVIFSHGFGGTRVQSFFFTEHLASHGFVVAAPDHPGNTFADVFLGGGDAAQSAMDRPLDVIFAVDTMLGGDLPIDPARIAVAGHSFGGWTSLEVARRDPRFRVIIPMAPGFREGSTPDFVAELGRPVAIFGGSEDDTCPFDTDQLRPYELAAPPKILVGITGAGHLDFSNLCEVAIAAAFVDDGCDPAKIEPREVHARTVALATAFARRFLSGEVAYEAFLDPAYALSLGRLEYWSMID